MFCRGHLVSDAKSFVAPVVSYATESAGLYETRLPKVFINVLSRLLGLFGLLSEPILKQR